VEQNRGIALILALLILSFLSIIGGALLTTSTIDIWISDNYKTSTQSLYVAEAGIDHAREMLRDSTSTPTQLLIAAAGPDRLLSTSTDLAALLASDDQPLIPSDPSLRSAGQPLIDSSGQVAGYYYVWLRNDNADGKAALTDSNEVLTLLSVGQVWGTRKVIDVTVQKWRFPETAMDARLKTSSGLNDLVASVTRNAADVYGSETFSNYGGPANYRVAVVNGDAELRSGTGFGILLVRGALNLAADFTWNGIVLVIGPGAIQVDGTINGGFFIAPALTPAGVTYTVTDAAQVHAASQPFPYNPIAIRER
jgi:hypothetical protein